MKGFLAAHREKNPGEQVEILESVEVFEGSGTGLELAIWRFGFGLGILGHLTVDLE